MLTHFDMSTRQENIEVIMSSMHAIKRKLMMHSPKALDIPHSQWAVLCLVMEQDALGVKDIAKSLGVTSSAATQLIDVLVEKKYLIRKSDENDRRALSLSLSDGFKKKMGAMKEVMLRHFTEVFGGLNNKELSQYAALNKKLANSKKL